MGNTRFTITRIKYQISLSGVQEKIFYLRLKSQIFLSGVSNVSVQVIHCITWCTCEKNDTSKDFSVIKSRIALWKSVNSLTPKK